MKEKHIEIYEGKTGKGISPEGRKIGGKTITVHCWEADRPKQWLFEAKDNEKKVGGWTIYHDAAGGQWITRKPKEEPPIKRVDVLDALMRLSIEKAREKNPGLKISLPSIENKRLGEHLVEHIGGRFNETERSWELAPGDKSRHAELLLPLKKIKVFEGLTRKGFPVSVWKEVLTGLFGENNGYKLTAYDANGGRIGDRTILRRKNGEYVLGSESKDTGCTVVTEPGKGVGPLLVALGLGAVVEEGGTKARIDKVENVGWRNRLVNEMNGRIEKEGGSRKLNVVWTANELAPPDERSGKNHWHNFLPQEIRERLQKMERH